MFQQPMQYGPGTGTFIDHSLEIFFMLAGAFLIGLWLGWLIWSRYQKQFEKYRQENESHAATALTLRTQVEELNARISAAESDRAGLNAQVNSSNWENTELRQKLDAMLAESEKSSAKVRQLETELALGNMGRPEEQPFQFNLPIELEDKPDLPLPILPEWEIPVPAPSEWALPVMPPMPAPPKTEQITEIAVDNGAVALDLSIFDIPAFHPAPPFVQDQASDATPIPPPPGLIPEDDEPEIEHFEAEMQPVAASKPALVFYPVRQERQRRFTSPRPH
jgi:outer membrane murein-binding lipoprotein Lpp